MVIIFAIICGVITGVIAASKNRSAVGFGVLGFFLPVIGLVAVACLPAVKSVEQVIAEAEIARMST